MLIALLLAVGAIVCFHARCGCWQQFTDDTPGFPIEHPHAQALTRLTAEEVTALQAAAAQVHQKLVRALVAAGKFNWQAFPDLRSYGDGTNSGVTKDTCESFMNTYCPAQMQEVPMLMGAGCDPSPRCPEPDGTKQTNNQSVAAFLIVRPPIAFFGWGWESDDRMWHDLFLLQVGTPTGTCQSNGNGIYTRDYTKGTAKLDCNTWQADLPFPSL